MSKNLTNPEIENQKKQNLTHKMPKSLALIISPYLLLLFMIYLPIYYHYYYYFAIYIYIYISPYLLLFVHLLFDKYCLFIYLVIVSVANLLEHNYT